jgi:hypothetical protein
MNVEIAAEPAPPEAEWAIVEIMGHRRHYGQIHETSRFGVVMLQINVPTEAPDAFIRLYYAASARFAVTPCTEATARAGAKAMRPQPQILLAMPAEDEADLAAANEPEPDDEILDEREDDMEF